MIGLQVFIQIYVQKHNLDASIKCAVKPTSDRAVYLLVSPRTVNVSRSFLIGKVTKLWNLHKS